MMSRTKNPQKQNVCSRRKKKSFITELVACHHYAEAPEMSDRHQNSITSPYSTPKDKNNSTCIGSKNGYRIETLNNVAKCNTSNQILQKETADSNSSDLTQINTSSCKEPSIDGNVGNGNWSLPQDSILKDNSMNIDVKNRWRNHISNNFNPSIDRAQMDSSNGMNSQLTQDDLQSYQPEFRYPQYQTLTARKSSYDKWQFGHKQSPDVLSKAGYFYTGEQDIVRCFCCDLGLAEWDAEDNAWREHARHNPKCWFLKSQKGESYIKEIQFDWKKIYNPKHTAFDDKQSRVATFGGWRMDIEPDILADAGFFYTGEEDVVRCHYCDGGLRHWEPGDVPWEEHARWFPFCKYIIKMKGRDFIDNIKAAREIDNDEKTHQHLGKKEKLIKKVKQLQSPLLKENQLIELENTELVFPLLKEQHVLKEREGDLQKEDELKEQVKTELLADNILFRRTKIRNAKSKMNFSSVYRGCYLYRKNILARMLVSLEQLIEALDSIKSPHYIWPSGHPLILTKERQIELDFSSNEYLERLYSFVNGINRRHRTWNSDQIVRPEPMVLAGFSYDGEDDKVVCKSCGAISDVNDWSDDDEDYAFTMHRRTGSSHCEFLRKFDPWRSKM